MLSFINMNVIYKVMIFLLFFLYSYIPIWNIVDARWELQLHRPLHAAA